MSRKHALITGASHGIGHKLARGLAQDGYQLALLSRSGDELRALSDSLPAAALALPCDVRDASACVVAVDAAVAAFGKIDVLINCAGIFKPGNLDLECADLDALYETNVRGTFNMVKAVIDHLPGEGGHIINFASRRGVMAHPGEALYSASKFAVVGFSEALYKELAPRGIKVTAICPGWVYTDMARSAPVPRTEMIQTEDMLATVRYLLALSSAACVKKILMEPAGDLM